MNKVSMIAVSLVLTACVKSPDLRPESYLKTEELLQQGISAYKDDDFSEARQKFNSALELYKSFDNDKGIALSQANLVETALATSDFLSAESYVKKLQQQAADNALDAELKHKVILLKVKLAFEQQNYPAALASLQPLLAEGDEQKKPDDAQLTLLAMQARLEVLISPLKKSAGLAKFEAAIAQFSSPPAHYQALLKHTLAIASSKRGDYQTAITLLTAALNHYKEQANRRSIAACLEELANVEIAQQHQQAAREYLNKALVIRQWLKNEVKSTQIRRQLTALSTHAETVPRK